MTAHIKPITCQLILENGDVVNLEDSSSKLNAIYDEILKNGYLEGRFIYYNNEEQQEPINGNLDMFIVAMTFEISNRLILNSKIDLPVYGYGNIVFESEDELVIMSGEYMKKLTFSRNSFLKDTVACGKAYLDLLKQLYKQYGIYEELIEDIEKQYLEAEALLQKANIA